MSKTFIQTLKIDKILKEKILSRRKLSNLVGYNFSSFNEMINGERSFSESVIKKLLPILEVSREEFESWIIVDKYPKETIQLAIEAKQTKLKDKKLILTAKIGGLLESKGISRTAFSKQIKHSQSSFNNSITGKEPLSKNLMTKISAALEIPVEHIQAWILADKYSLNVLKLALEESRE
jgi:plasmid maintenance system antidote protein VapI